MYKKHVLCQHKKTTSLSIQVCNAKLKLNGNRSVMSNHLLKLNGLNIKDVDSDQPRDDTAIPNQQVSINQSFLNTAAHCESSLNYEHLLAVTSDFIIKSGQPLSIVDDPHFIRLFAEFENNSSLFQGNDSQTRFFLKCLKNSNST